MALRYVALSTLALPSLSLKRAAVLVAADVAGAPSLPSVAQV